MSIGGFLVPLFYVFTSLLAFADYSIPLWVGLAGVVVLIVGNWVFWRAHKDLGQNWSPTLEIREALLERLRTENNAGVLFKLVDAPYTPGRPNSGGPQLKHKFYATLSAVVGKVNAQRSVEVREGAGWRRAVTIPVHHLVPAVGAVAEVRYRYAFRESRCLYQPKSSDVTESEYIVAQLKFKAGGGEGES